MKAELETDGVEVQFVILHGSSASTSTSQDKMIEQVSFPVFQDDIYIFRSDLALSAHFPHGGSVSTNLSTDEGWGNVLDAITTALEESEALETD